MTRISLILGMLSIILVGCSNEKEVDSKNQNDKTDQKSVKSKTPTKDSIQDQKVKKAEAKSTTDEYQVALEKANASYNSGQWQIAINHYKMASQLKPNQEFILNRISLCTSNIAKENIAKRQSASSKGKAMINLAGNSWSISSNSSNWTQANIQFGYSNDVRIMFVPFYQFDFIGSYSIVYVPASGNYSDGYKVTISGIRGEADFPVPRYMIFEGDLNNGYTGRGSDGSFLNVTNY